MRVLYGVSIGQTAQATQAALGSDPTTPLAALIEAARSGDGAAFETLLGSRVDRTYRTARAILGNDADARDAVQEAWLAVWRQLPRLREPASFEGWLDRILLNACRTALRRRGRVREIPMAAEHDGRTWSGEPEQVAERDMVERAFQRLTADQRAILVLHHLQRRPVAEIAHVLGVPEGTVKWRLHAARAALDRALEHDR
jgi:RNA polymerase sigma-70 factor (ECF subfamily)